MKKNARYRRAPKSKMHDFMKFYAFFMKQRTIQSGNLHSEQRRMSSLEIGERLVRQGDEFAQECAKALEGFADSFVFGGVGGWVFPVPLCVLCCRFRVDKKCLATKLCAKLWNK
jgi:hypothetical protein